MKIQSVKPIVGRQGATSWDRMSGGKVPSQEEVAVFGNEGRLKLAGGEAGSRGAGQHRLQHPLQTTRVSNGKPRHAACATAYVSRALRLPRGERAIDGREWKRARPRRGLSAPGTRLRGALVAPGAQGASCGDRQRPPANSRRDLTGPSSSPSGSGPPVPLTPSAMALRGHWGAASAGTLSQTHPATLDTEFAPKSLTKTKRFIKALCEITKAYCY